jgi:hypothetical protein
MSKIMLVFTKLGIIQVYIFALFSTALYAQDYKVYTLYNGEFDVIFPTKPFSESGGYISVNQEKKLAFTAVKLPSALGSNIGEYNQNALDKTFQDSMKQLGNKIVKFHSTMNRKENLYIYTMTYTRMDPSVGVLMYNSVKTIISNKGTYRWSIVSPSNSSRHIFDKYQTYCKVNE